MLSKVQKYIDPLSSIPHLEALQEASQHFEAMEASALSTLINLPGKAFTIIIAIGKNTGLWSEPSLFGS